MGSKPKSVQVQQARSSAELAPIRSTALQDLQRQAAGKGPSIAAEQLKAAQEKTLAQQLAAAQARPTRNVGALQRQLLQEQGTAGRQLAQVGALARAQEQLGAQNQLLGLTESDLNRAAGINQANAQLEAQRQSAIASNRNALTGALIGAGGTIGASLLTAGAPAAVPAVAKQAIPNTNYSTPTPENPLWFSDERVKENIKPAKKEVRSFLDALEARRYNYQEDIDASKAEKYGIMAQDLEKSDMGKSLVKEVNGVKAVDAVQGFGAILAAQAELNKRLNKLESKKKKS